MSFLKRFFQKKSKNSVRLPGSGFEGHCQPECGIGTLTVGFGTYGRPIIINSVPTDSVSIGKFCSISAGVKIFGGGEHDTNRVSTYPFRTILTDPEVNCDVQTKGPTIIGNEVWIGTDALVLSGVTIGDGAVIGARALVCSEVAPYTVVGGNPAKIIRRRFSDLQITELLKIRWWDWDARKIEENVDWFYKPVDAFIQNFRI